jgi:hypothetical protein
MATPVKLYQKEMHDNTGFFATWLPGDPIEIGDVGKFEGGRFRRMSSLKELGIEFSVSRGQSTQNVDYSSTRGTKISSATGAEVAAIAKAEISIDFSEQGAFVFQALQLQPWQLENRMIIGEQVVKAYEANRWDKSWLLIESLHSAERATVIVSEDSAAGLVLVAKFDQVIPSISLVDPKVSLSVASSRGKMVRLIGNEGLHPLYSCLRLKDSFFGPPSLQPVRGAKDARADSQFSRPGIGELLES